MLRKLLALLLVISMVGMSSGLVWDFEKLFTGRQMVPYGAPWIADDQKMYFGTGKDVSLEYDEDGLGGLNITGNTTVTGTLAVTSATTLDGLTVAEEATFSASVVHTPYVNNTAGFTIGDSGYFVFHIGDAAGNQTVVLPTAADNIGRALLFVITEDPGDNSFIIDGEGNETVGGAATKTCTDAVGSFYYIYCTGTSWITLASGGTWT